MKLYNLKKLENIVLEVLTENEDTRFSDHILYVAVVQKIKPSFKGFNFKTLFELYEYYNLPSFKAVERCRRKLTEIGKYTPPDNIKKGREELIKKYVEYATYENGGIEYGR